MKILILLVFAISLNSIELKSKHTKDIKSKLHLKNSKESIKGFSVHNKNNKDYMIEYVSMIEKKLKALKDKGNSTPKQRNGRSHNRSRSNAEDEDLNFMETSSQSNTRLEQLTGKINDNSKTANVLEKSERKINEKLEILDNEFNELKNQKALEKKKMVNLEAEVVDANTLRAKQGDFNVLQISSLNAGGLNISSASSVINLNLLDSIIIGKESITAQNILEMVEFVRQVKSFCGDFFRDCRIISETQYKEEQNSINEIRNRMDSLNHHFK